VFIVVAKLKIAPPTLPVFVVVALDEAPPTTAGTEEEPTAAAAGVGA